MKIEMEPIKGQGSTTFTTNGGAGGVIVWLGTIVFGGLTLYVIGAIFFRLLALIY